MLNSLVFICTKILKTEIETLFSYCVFFREKKRCLIYHMLPSRSEVIGLSNEAMYKGYKGLLLFSNVKQIWFSPCIVSINIGPISK